MPNIYLSFSRPEPADKTNIHTAPLILVILTENLRSYTTVASNVFIKTIWRFRLFDDVDAADNGANAILDISGALIYGAL